ncbi:hypothetical protein O181_025254 [Austropuccinia psidii MF-1]|uniref:Uncharacterized protein n=1 Tax=Austropuccinia psidii MF-1 TaxID=1389203 RepID=A0A9Q3CK72_9BASI|nr:hypothetical protein [Austropuccinia psidii MF-1]
MITEIIITHRKGNIRPKQELLGLEDAHIPGFLLRPYYQSVYGINIYNSKRYITICTNKENKFSLYIYQLSNQGSLEELLNEFKEGEFSSNLTSEQNLSLLKTLSKNSPAFSIGEGPLGKNRRHGIELYLDVERPYPPMLGRPQYPGILKTRKDIEKHNHQLLEMGVIRKIGHNEIVEVATPVLITWNNGQNRFFEDFRVLNN